MKTQSDQQLPILQDLKSGRWYYHYMRETKTIEMEGEERTIYEASTVKIEGQPTYEKLVEAVVREHYSSSEEIALINNYLSYQADNTLEQYLEEYINYQADRVNIKTMVQDDCTEAGII